MFNGNHVSLTHRLGDMQLKISLLSRIIQYHYHQ